LIHPLTHSSLHPRSNYFIHGESSPPRGRPSYSPKRSLSPHGGESHSYNGSFSPTGEIITLPQGESSPHMGEIIILPKGESFRSTYLYIKASQSRNSSYFPPGESFPPGEIIILPTGEVFPHRGRSSYSPRGSRSETLTYL
jgi:hypothetical protein